MQQHIWIFRQLFISFVLFHYLNLFNTIVNARVIRKRDIDSYENVTINVPNITTTEKIAIIKNITPPTTISSAITTTLGTTAIGTTTLETEENLEKLIATTETRTDVSLVKNTPLPIARITVNDMKILTTTEHNDDDDDDDNLTIDSITTENSGTTFQVGNVLESENKEAGLSTKPTIIDKEHVTEEISTIDVPTTTENVYREKEPQESFDETTASDMIADETTTLGLFKIDNNKNPFTEYTPERSKKEAQSEFNQPTTISEDNQQTEKSEFTTTQQSIINYSQTEINDNEKNIETTTVQEERNNINENNKQLKKPIIITTPAAVSTIQTTTTTETTSPLNISNLILKNNTITPSENKKILIDKSTNYDVTTNEIRNITIISSNKTGSEKRPKQLKDSNMTLPDAPEVWALAGMKNGIKEINNFNNGGKLLNITVIDQDNALSEINSTGSTKLLADWTQIMKEVDINNSNNNNNNNKNINNNDNNTSVKISPNSIENILENENEKIKETSLLNSEKSHEKLVHENQVISNVVNPIHKSKVNQSSTKANIILTSSINTPTGQETEKTPTSIEKNQVEDADSEYISNKKNKIKNITRNGIIKDDHSAIVLGKLTTSTSTSSPFGKVIQLTTQSQLNSILETTTTPQPVLTSVISGAKTITTESNFINKKFTTLSALANLVDATTFAEIIPSISSANVILNVSARNSTENYKEINNQIGITEKEHINLHTTSSIDHKDKVIENVSSITTLPVQDVYSSSTSELSSTGSTISSSSLQTDINDNISTTSEESVSSSNYGTQVKSDIEYLSSSSSSSSITEEYLKLSTTESTVSDESSSTESLEIKISTTELTTGISTESSTIEGVDDQSTSETSKMSTTTFISPPPLRYDSTPGIMTSTEDISTTTIFQNTPTKYDPHFIKELTTPTTTMQSNVIPKILDITTEEAIPTSTSTLFSVSTHDPNIESGGAGAGAGEGELEGGDMMPHPPHSEDTTNMSTETDYNVIIAISVSVVGIIALILLVGFLYVMRKRQKNLTYGQRCRPVSLDAYSLDNVSIYNSVRRKGALRASKRSYGNVAFDDPSLKNNVLNINDLSKFVEKKSTIYEEFKDVPQVIARPDEVPQGCEDKNRYANVIPLPETRVILQQLNGDDKTEYINANYVQGPKDPPNYYIACQAPLESTIADFWRMIWEQNSRVIIQATDLIENGKEKCAEYLPPSITIDNHVGYGDFQITLRNREVKEKYAVSILHIKNTSTNTWRELTHFWYQWPETGVPNDEAGVIAMLLEARSYLKISTQEQIDNEEDVKTTGITTTTVATTTPETNGNLGVESNGNIDKTKSLSKVQGPLTVHCSPGTGRTGTIIACDISLRSLETPKRSIDIPQIVYYVRRGRASAVQTKEQYEFIYRVAHMYATKISGPINET